MKLTAFRSVIPLFVAMTHFAGCLFAGGAASRHVEYYYDGGKKVAYRPHPGLLYVSVRGLPEGESATAYVGTIAAGFGLRVVTVNQIDDLSSPSEPGLRDRLFMRRNIWLLARSSGEPFARTACQELARLRADPRITFAGAIIGFTQEGIVAYGNTGYAVMESALPAPQIDSLLSAEGCRAFNWDSPRSFFFTADSGMGEGFWEVQDRLMATGKFHSMSTEKVGE